MIIDKKINLSRQLSCHWKNGKNQKKGKKKQITTRRQSLLKKY